MRLAVLRRNFVRPERKTAESLFLPEVTFFICITSPKNQLTAPSYAALKAISPQEASETPVNLSSCYIC